MAAQLPGNYILDQVSLCFYTRVSLISLNSYLKAPECETKCHQQTHITSACMSSQACTINCLDLTAVVQSKLVYYVVSPSSLCHLSVVSATSSSLHAVTSCSCSQASGGERWWFFHLQTSGRDDCCSTRAETRSRSQRQRCLNSKV